VVVPYSRTISLQAEEFYSAVGCGMGMKHVHETARPFRQQATFFAQRRKIPFNRQQDRVDKYEHLDGRQVLNGIRYHLPSTLGAAVGAARLHDCLVMLLCLVSTWYVEREERERVM